MRTRRRIDAAIIALGILTCGTVLSACSLVNPYVTWDRPPSGAQTLQDGIAYANRAQDKYKEAIGDQAKLTNILGLGLIPLSAAALGLGVTDGSGAVIAALGLAGGASYASGTWLSSRPRQLVYVAGIKAMTCAVDAMLPLAFSPDARKAFKDDLSGLNSAIGTFLQQVARVRELLEKVKRDYPDEQDVIADTERDLHTADTLQDTARSAFTSGTQLHREIDRAGLMLMSAVDWIGAEVDRAITATLPDIQGLPGIVGGLAQTSAQFGKLPEVKKGGEQMTGKTTTKETLQLQADKPTVKQLNDEKDALKTQAIALGSPVRAVSAVVNAVSEAKPSATLKQCGVEEVATGLAVVPPAPVEFEKGKDATTRLVITGGKPPYVAELLEEPVEGLTVSQPVKFGSRVVIQITSKAALGQYTVLITDTASNTKTIGVTIKEPVPEKQPATSTQPGAVVPSPEDQQKVQQTLCVPAGEKFDSERTTAAIKNFQETLRFTVTGKLTAEQVTALKAAKACQSGRTNFFENQMTEERIRGIQKKLGTDMTGKLDDKTRAAIQMFATDKWLKPKDGTLTKSLVDKIET